VRVHPTGLALAMLLGLAAGCAGVRVADGSYVVPAKGYRVGAPPGWTRLPGEADLTLGRDELRAGLMAHATCEGKPPTRPLPVLARHLRFGLREIQDLVEFPTEVGGLPGQASRFQATLDGIPVAVRAVTLTGAGCVYDLLGVAPPETMPAVARDFDRFVAGFGLLTGTP
jgi:hypothetical protein